MSLINGFTKRRDYLVCVDSDGCVMDTMNSKHFFCFGPCMVEEWELGEWRDEILERWNQINLYQVTRGINRFKGLAMALTEINERYTRIAGIDTLNEWCKTTHALSMPALFEAIKTTDSGDGRLCLAKALSWSKAVNERIDALSGEVKTPFTGAKECLVKAHSLADVAVVSSANRDAVLEEWGKFELLCHTDVTLAQDMGSKAYCIGEMLKLGYDKAKTLMVGDAMGDLDAARANEVYYFPILPGKEKESWQELSDTGLARLIDGTFGGEYQQKKICEFMGNFK